MARKLRIFPGESHAFESHPQLSPFTMPPRKLREKGQLFVLPEGFEPFNPAVYNKKYGHRLAKLAAQQQQQQQQQQQPGSSGSGAAGER